VKLSFILIVIHKRDFFEIEDRKPTRAPLYDYCDAKCKLARHSGSEYSRARHTHTHTLYLGFNRSAETKAVVAVGCRRRRDFGIRWVRDVHFSFSSVGAPSLSANRMTRRIVLFERENTTMRKVLLTRSRATIRVFAGSSISFYLVTLSLRRRVECKSNRGETRRRE